MFYKNLRPLLEHQSAQKSIRVVKNDIGLAGRHRLLFSCEYFISFEF